MGDQTSLLGGLGAQKKNLKKNWWLCVSYLRQRARTRARARRPDLGNRNSDWAKNLWEVQNPQKKLIFKILGQSEFFYGFYAIYCE